MNTDYRGAVINVNPVDASVISLGAYMEAREVMPPPGGAWTIHARDGSILGAVDWYARWRCYVLSPESTAVFSDGCLRDLAGFLAEQTRKERK